jgi:hypothetical protein
MITQILGVALISLLTITPTIQQNNIEQLNAPNIEIQQNTLNTPDVNRLWVKNQFSYYDSSRSAQQGRDPDIVLSNINSHLYTNTNTLIQTSVNEIYTNFTVNNLYIIDNDFYFHISNFNNFLLTGAEIVSIMRNYYNRMRGSFPTSESVSFNTSGSTLTAWDTNYYTYTFNGTQGSMVGRIYVKSQSIVDTNTGSITNNSISVPQNTTLQNLIQNYLIPNETLEQSSAETSYNRILYYWLDSSLPLSTIGQYTRTLYARTNYGRVLNYGSFSVNVLSPDTTPPTITSITGNSTNWTNQNITLTVQANDNIALNSQAYSFNDGVTYQTSNQSTFTTNQFVNIRVRDSSNNYISQTVTINRIDKQSPAIVLAGNWKNTFQLGELPNNQQLLNYLSISDGASGVNTNSTTISNFNFNQAGSYSNIQVSATDNAGNTNVFTLPTVTITQPADNTGPIITGPTIVNVVEGNILTQAILDLYLISDISGIEPNTIMIRDLNNNIITNWSPYTVGSYQLRVYARDTLNNITQYQFTLQVGEAPPPDLTPPTIVGPLLVSFEIGTYTSNTEILNLYTFSDNVGIIQNQLIGNVDYETLGDYEVIIRSTDTSNNVSNKNIVVRIRADVVLGNYNPLTDLLSGIFGGALSMIFTIGTINVLGLRLLDAMGVIILGAVLLFVYKAIKGGS